TAARPSATAMPPNQEAVRVNGDRRQKQPATKKMFADQAMQKGQRQPLMSMNQPGIGGPSMPGANGAKQAPANRPQTAREARARSRGWRAAAWAVADMDIS